MNTLEKTFQRLVKICPIGITIGGKKSKAAMFVADIMLTFRGNRNIFTNYGEIYYNYNIYSERFMGIFFENIINHYRSSSLGKYIINKPWSEKSFIDVGANLGIYSLIARSCGAQTYLVEPEPSHADFLKRNESVFGLVIQAAAGQAKDALPIYYSPDNPGATSLVPADGYMPSAKTVEVNTISAMVDEGRFGPPSDIDLIKIDVEGFEEQAIMGLHDFFRTGARPDIWCEVRGQRSSRAPNSFLVVAKALQKFGYRGFDGGKSNPFEHPYGPELEATFSNRQVFDMLFTHEGVKSHQ